MASFGAVANMQAMAQQAAMMQQQTAQIITQGYGSMPKPPRKNPPKPADEGETK